MLGAPLRDQTCRFHRLGLCQIEPLTWERKSFLRWRCYYPHRSSSGQLSATNGTVSIYLSSLFLHSTWCEIFTGINLYMPAFGQQWVRESTPSVRRQEQQTEKKNWTVSVLCWRMQIHFRWPGHVPNHFYCSYLEMYVPLPLRVLLDT